MVKQLVLIAYPQKFLNIDDIILEFANQIQIQSTNSSQWYKCYIVHNPKSSNHRGIVLSEFIAKIINKILLIAFNIILTLY